MKNGQGGQLSNVSQSLNGTAGSSDCFAKYSRIIEKANKLREQDRAYASAMNSASRTATAEYTQNLNTYQENQYLQQ